MCLCACVPVCLCACVLCAVCFLCAVSYVRFPCVVATGELISEEGRVTGTGDGDLCIPSMDHDADLTKLEVVITPCTDGGEADRRLAALFKRYGIPALRKQLARFVTELKAQ